MVDNDGDSTSEARLRRALQAARIGVWEWDIVQNHVTWSPELYVLFDVAPHAFDGSVDGFMACVHPADREHMGAAIQHSLQTGADHHIEHRVATSGAERWVECKGSTFRDADGKPVRMAGVVWDCTERMRMQAQLRLADRMANVGTLTASIAHEINNPLAFWLLSLQNVDRELGFIEEGTPATSVGELRKTLGEMRASAEHVRQILRDLRLFSRADEAGRRRIDVHSVLEPAITLTEAELRPRARLVRDFGRLPFVEANEARLGQVFLNLLLNASQAIAPGAPERNAVRVRTHRSNAGEAVIEVSDTGHGIPPQLVERIFDPFFTTKPVGMGTGLGLSICHNIVTSLGGRITVSTKPGEGSTFKVVLPPAAQPARATATSEATSQPVTGGRRILIVDDAPNLAASLRMALHHHEVEAVFSGREALERLRVRDYDSILCDLMMPGMDGVELHSQLATLKPGLEKRMIFFTGGAFTPRARDFLTRLENPLLEKPFDLERLEALIATQPPLVTPAS